MPVETSPSPLPQPLPHGAPRRRLRLQFAALTCFAALALAAAVYGPHAAKQGDVELTAAEQQARVDAFVRAGRLNLPEIPRAGREAALQTMALDQQSPNVREAVQDAATRLIWLTLWDDCDEDGDTVEIISDAYRRTVRLTNAPIQIAVPAPSTGVLNVRGVFDGGGGITVAIRTAQGAVAMPVMAVGQVIGVPIAAP